MKYPSSMLRAVAFALLLVSLSFSAALAQEEDGQTNGTNPPQILTTDLSRTQEVEEEEMEAHFVFADSDPIEKITINGEPQKFVKADTVLISKSFAFKQGANMIEVVAIDHDGNSRTKTFLVECPTCPAPEPEGPPKAPFLPVRILISFAPQTDQNPLYFLNNRNSFPDTTVPEALDGNEFTLMLAGEKENLSGGFGLFFRDFFQGNGPQVYSAVDIESKWISLAYRDPQEDGANLVYAMGLGLVEDQNKQNGYDLIMASLGQENRREEGGRVIRSLYSLDLAKEEANNESVLPSGMGKLRWEYDSRDGEWNDLFHLVGGLGVKAYGSGLVDLFLLPTRMAAADLHTSQKDFVMNAAGTEFYDPAKYGFASMDLDLVKNIYHVRLDLGAGMEYRKYSELDEQGSLMRGTMGLGYQFKRNLGLVYHYTRRMSFLSHNPYRRDVHGLSLTYIF